MYVSSAAGFCSSHSLPSAFLGFDGCFEVNLSLLNACVRGEMCKISKFPTEEARKYISYCCKTDSPKHSSWGSKHLSSLTVSESQELGVAQLGFLVPSVGAAHS